MRRPPRSQDVFVHCLLFVCVSASFVTRCPQFVRTQAAGERLVMEQHARWAQQNIDQFSHFFDKKGASNFMTRQAGQTHGQTYSSRQLVSAVLFAWHLRDNVGVKEALPSALDHILPGWLPHKVLATGQHVCPSRTIMRRAQLSLDAALMLSRRDVSALTGARYGWADSSTVAQSDWFVSKHQFVQHDLVESTCRASQELVRSRPDFHEGEVDKGRRCELSKHVLNAVRIYTQPPMSMASGVTSLQHKLAVLTYSLFLEIGSVRGLSAFLGTFVSYTTDMGTEFGTASFLVTDIKSLLPEWLRNPWMEADVDGDDDVQVSMVGAWSGPTCVTRVRTCRNIRVGHISRWKHGPWGPCDGRFPFKTVL